MMIVCTPPPRPQALLICSNILDPFLNRCRLLFHGVDMRESLIALQISSFVCVKSQIMKSFMSNEWNVHDGILSTPHRNSLPTHEITEHSSLDL